MARVNKQILGLIKGSLGEVVFRERNGKVFVYSKPVKQKVSKSPSAVNARKKFALRVSLAQILNSNKILFQVWNLSKVDATNAYQKIIKVNTSLSEGNHLTLLNRITPEEF